MKKTTALDKILLSKILLYSLILFGLGCLIIVLFSMSAFTYLDIQGLLNTYDKDAIVLLLKTFYPPMAILTSALIAGVGIVQNIHNSQEIEKMKSEKESSKFFLNNSLDELNNVYGLLKDKNNDRVTWILSARVLIMSQELSKKITQEEHKKVYELKLFQLKHKLLDLFESEEYKRLEFYAGLDISTKYTQQEVINKLHYSTIKAPKDLTEVAVFTIFSFLEYPENYKDPLNDDMLLTTESTLDEWKKAGQIGDIKQYPTKYLKVKLNENGKYDKKAYEGLIL